MCIVLEGHFWCYHKDSQCYIYICINIYIYIYIIIIIIMYHVGEILLVLSYRCHSYDNVPCRRETSSVIMKTVNVIFISIYTYIIFIMCHIEGQRFVLLWRQSVLL